MAIYRKGCSGRIFHSGRKLRRGLRLLIVVPVLGAALSGPAAAQTAYVPSSPVGNLAGAFTVNGNGSANHSFSIDVPPGTRGVAPELSVTYDSHRGNGYIGMGWALNGISAISRCGANYRTDGYKAGVDPLAYKVVSGKLYLNYSRSVQRTWSRDIPGYISKADGNWPGLE